MVQQDLKDDVLTVRSSDVREEILRELAKEDLRRPSEIKDPVYAQTGTSDGNFFNSLSRLAEANLVEKISSEGRTTLYSLTDRGRKVAEELDLTQSPDTRDSQAGASTADTAEGAQPEIDRRNVAFMKEQLRDQMKDAGVTYREIQKAVDELSEEFAESTEAR